MQFLYSGNETDPLPIVTSDSSSEDSKSRKYFEFSTTVSTHRNAISTSISFSTIRRDKKKINNDICTYSGFHLQNKHILLSKHRLTQFL